MFMIRPLRLHQLAVGTAIAAISSACSAGGAEGSLAPPPPAIQASFKGFADSIIPRLQDTLFRAGYRNHVPDDVAPSTAPVEFHFRTADVSAADRAADLYEGVIEGEMERNGDVTSHWPLSFHFARAPGTSKWVLLTSANYPDDGQPRTPASAPRLPPIVMAVLLPQFKETREWQAWWELGEKRRAKAAK